MNKFIKYFSEDMTSDQARTKYFSFVGTVTDEDEIKELTEAYNAVSSKILKRELQYASENDILF